MFLIKRTLKIMLKAQKTLAFSHLTNFFKVDFSKTYLMSGAENSVSWPPHLKIFWGRIPTDPLQMLMSLALARVPFPPPLTKKPSHGPDRKGGNIKWNGSYLASTIQF